MSHTDTLLVELVTEELPPKVLRKLGNAFAQQIFDTLKKQHLLDESSTLQAYATPRRLASLITHVRSQAPDQSFSEKLMPTSVGINDQGQASTALIKKLDAKGWGHITLEQLERINDGKTEQLFYKGIATGVSLSDGLQIALHQALNNLPIPKVMSYQLADGKTSVKFVRPAHGLVALHGNQIVPVSALGLQATNRSSGHRFQGQAQFDIPHADHYEQTLKEIGHVIASFDKRKTQILTDLQTHAQQLNLSLGNAQEVDELLEEVTALVEYPCVYKGEFETTFLAVPQECLILTMRLNQKYFPLFKSDDISLDHHFLIVSNMSLSDPHHIIEGNQRVIRPRLADAQFFFETDKKTPLAQRVHKLESIVYHNKLGTQFARTQRVQALCAWLASQFNADVELAQRAAYLAKADLSSGMVGEFPELQGVMGSYYAQYDHEDPRVALAIAQQYQIRFDSPLDNEHIISAILFAAERVETLMSIWSIGLVPSGDKDPYGLRRAALGLISVLEQFTSAPTDFLRSLLHQAGLGLGITPNDANALINDVEDFIYERYRHQLLQQYSRDTVDAVISLKPAFAQIGARIVAVEQFKTLSQAQNLAAANKRIGNILKKNSVLQDTTNPELYQEKAEKHLDLAIKEIKPKIDTALQMAHYDQALNVLANVSSSVDQFFNDVMVMAEDPQIKENRLALLSELYRLLNAVADISRLET